MEALEKKIGAREMVQWLIALAIHLENLVGFLAPMLGQTITCYPNLKEYDIYFWPLWAPIMHVVHR